MRLSLLNVVAFSAVLLAPRDATAQQQQDDAATTVTVAGALGSAQLTCQGCEGTRKSAPSGYVRVGRPVARGLVVSAELDVWSKGESWSVVDTAGATARGTSRFTITTIDAVAQWYPAPAHGFFLDAGLGVGRYQATSKSRDIGGTRMYSNAIGYQAGAGYDIPLSDRVALTPSLKVFGIAFAKSSDLDGRFGANVGQIALGLTFR